MYEGQVPFDQHGNPVPYVRQRASLVWEDNAPFVWEDNAPFTATLVFKRFERCRSAAHAVYVKYDDPSWVVIMFLSDLEDVIASAFIPLHLTGTFEYVKRGQNYGVKLIEIA